MRLTNPRRVGFALELDRCVWAVGEGRSTERFAVALIKLRFSFTPTHRLLLLRVSALGAKRRNKYPNYLPTS